MVTATSFQARSRCANRPDRGAPIDMAVEDFGDRLRRLTDTGLLTRDSTRPGQRAAYSLIEAAIQLVPVLTDPGARGIRHRHRP
jgi:hypothetical protein